MVHMNLNLERNTLWSERVYGKFAYIHNDFPWHWCTLLWLAKLRRRRKV